MFYVYCTNISKLIIITYKELNLLYYIYILNMILDLSLKLKENDKDFETIEADIFDKDMDTVLLSLKNKAKLVNLKENIITDSEIEYKQENRVAEITKWKYTLIIYSVKWKWVNIEIKKNNKTLKWGLPKNIGIIKFNSVWELRNNQHLISVLDNLMWDNRPTFGTEITKIYNKLNLKECEATKWWINIESKENLKKMNLKTKPINLWYKEIYKLWKLSLPKEFYEKFDKKSTDWRIIRALRFKSITSTVEQRYGLPNWLLTAMMCQESYWDPTTPNITPEKTYPNKNWSWSLKGRGISKKYWVKETLYTYKQFGFGKHIGCDWWLGPIHIQWKNAKEYWMKSKFPSNGNMADFKHGKSILDYINKYKNNSIVLSKFDDRFHYIMAMDVSARFLLNQVEWKSLSRADQNIDYFATRNKRQHALKWYAWKQNYRDYYKPGISLYMKKINSKQYISKLKSKFNGMKENVTLDWKPIDFDWYMDYFKKDAKNWWLDEYKAIWKR